MFGVILYIGACSAVAGAITFLWVITRPIHTRDEMRSWRVFGALMIIALSLPYGVFEALTGYVGKELDKGVEEAMMLEGIEGELRYYRVLWYDGHTAYVTAVGSEPSSWGGEDRPVLRITLEKTPKGWTATYAKVIYSDNRNKDGVVFPPYW